MSNDTFVDINNLGLTEEPLGDDFDPNASSFSGPPPLNKGTYLARISFRETDPSKQFQEKEYNTSTGHAAGRYFTTKVVGTVVTPENATGRKIFDDFVSTGLWNEDTSKIASILHSLGLGDEVRRVASEGGGHLALCRLFSNALAGEPLVRINVDWEGRVKEGDKYITVKKTQSEFKQREDGTFDPIIRDEEGNQIGAARLKIKGYYPAPSAAVA